MKITEVKQDDLYLITCNKEEATVFLRCVQKVMEEIPETGMSTRLGENREKVEVLYQKLLAISD